jgi:hypothetical protein
MEKFDPIFGNKKLPSFDHYGKREFWERAGKDSSFQEVLY